MRRRPSLRTQDFGDGGIRCSPASHSTMNACVLRGGDEQEILRSVVVVIPIDVMDVLVSYKESSKHPGHNKPVL